jgi:hypothetical protein
MYYYDICFCSKSVTNIYSLLIKSAITLHLNTVVSYLHYLIYVHNIHVYKIPYGYIPLMNVIFFIFSLLDLKYSHL